MAPIWIMLLGVILLIPVSRKHPLVSFLTSGCLLVYALVSISQGKYRDRGEKRMEDGQFAEAMVEYRKELDTWYLRAIYNHREGPSLYGIAQCQSQLEQFDGARETYLEMKSKLRGFYKKRAKKKLKALDANLAELDELKKKLTSQEDDQEKAMTRFGLALVYRKLDCTGKAIEQYEAIQSLEIPEQFQVQAQGFAEGLK